MKTQTAENIIGYLKTHKQARPKELEGFLDISRQALHKQLHRLLAAKKIDKFGKPPRVFYEAKSDISANKHDLNIKTIKEIAIPIFKKYNVSRASVFGSVARGEAHANSDIDLLVDIPSNHGLFEFIGLKNELQDSLKKKVDLVEYRAIKPVIKDNILKDQVALYDA